MLKVTGTLPTDQKEQGDGGGGGVWWGEAMKVDGRGEEMKGQGGEKRVVWR